MCHVAASSSPGAIREREVTAYGLGQPDLAPLDATPGGEAVGGRWGRSSFSGSLSGAFPANHVTALVCCTRDQHLRVPGMSQMPKVAACPGPPHHDGLRDQAEGTRDWQTMAAGDVPPYHELLWPALQAVGDLGGSASISEIVETVIKREGFSDAQQAVLHNDGPETEIGYRLAWARTYLKGMGLLTNSSRGVWALTDDGTALLTDPSATDDQRSERIQELRARYLTEMRTARKTRPPQDGEPDDMQSSTERSWKEQLLEQLMSMPPDAFERLARRLLREADFDSVNVTGQSGDGGIDGLGVYRLGLVSFPVFFQCKRYRGSVSPSAVRDFRGAMAGRGDKGLLITTGTFTADAKKEATRDGAPPIDLIDGDRLCELLKRYDLGVQTTTRTVEDVQIDAGFFAEI